MPNMNNKQQLILFKGQETLIEVATKAGFQCVGKRVDMVFSFEKTLEYELPEGFHFVEEDKINIEKVSECCWKGFDHEVEDGPWNGDAEHNYHLLQAPHATPQYTVVIENEKGEYVCYAGMWWTPQNHLAYMEPLCTVPSYRGKGLAAAALSELYRKMKQSGATHMTGGSNKFYSKIGFDPTIEWTFWRKNEIFEE
jgi:predicted N-acetyltransferase YhbS